MALRRQPLPVATAPRKRTHSSHAAATAAGTNASPSKPAARAREARARKAAAKGAEGERTTAAARRAAARAPGENHWTAGLAADTKKTLAAHASDDRLPARLVALAVALALATVFLMRRRIGRA
jgi:hypothetical protein